MMGISAFILFQLLGFVLTSKIIYKVFDVLFVLLVVLFKKFNKENKKVIFMNLVYGIAIVLVNFALNLNLDIFNFIYLSIFSFICYFFKLKVNVENYSSIYLLMVLVIGVITIWGSF